MPSERGVEVRGNTHRAYSPEYRAGAVRLVTEGGRTPRQASADLGCSEEALRSWMKQAAIDRGHRDGLRTEERDELRRLRAENRILKMERDILKKAAAFFAKESDLPR